VPLEVEADEGPQAERAAEVERIEFDGLCHH
jgi:hypothetical protein